MRIYKDTDFKHEITELDLGILQAGESKQYTLYLLNDTKAEVKNLNITINHNEIEILKSPSEISAGKMEELIIAWKPSVSLKQGIKNLPVHITGSELWSE